MALKKVTSKAEAIAQEKPVKSVRLSYNQIYLGALIVVLITLLFFSVNTWLENQTLKDQLDAAKRTISRLTTATNGTDTSATSTGQYVTDQSVDIIPAVSSKDHVVGASNPKLYVVEYSDLECPYCKKVKPALEQVISENAADVAHVFRHFPLDIHPNAHMEAQAAECVAQANGADNYFKYIKEVFARTSSTGTTFDEIGMVKIATDLGLDGNAVTQCLSAKTMQSRIDADLADGKKAGVSGTPTIFLIGTNGKAKMITGAVPAETIREAVAAILN